MISLLQIHLGHSDSVVYAAFIDPKGAFNTVHHSLLWQRLSQLGISSKIINILRSFYDIARVSIKAGTNTTPEVKVTRGVLQGEVLSGLLFILFIGDLGDFLRDRGCRGLSIDSKTEVLSLDYADDIVLVADTPTEFRKLLDALELYFNQKQLIVNVEKTKIVIFKKNKSVKPSFKSFKFVEQKIDVVDKFTYLGLPLTSTFSFKETVDYFISSANTAVGTVMKLIHLTKADSWRTYENLFKSLCLIVLFYQVQNWGLSHLDSIERVQLGFYKKLLFLPNNTPNYAVRLETGSPPLV